METITMVSDMRQVYNDKPLVTGTEFEASEADARDLEALRHAHRKPGQKMKATAGYATRTMAAAGMLTPQVETSGSGSTKPESVVIPSSPVDSASLASNPAFQSSTGAKITDDDEEKKEQKAGKGQYDRRDMRARK